MAEVRLSELIAPAFYDVHNRIQDGHETSFWLKGGRGSTKSSFAAIEIIQGMMDDPDANTLALRKIGDTIRTSVLGTFEWAIEILGVEQYWRVTVSPAEITYIPTGQKIIMKGADKPQKLKSIRLKRGYFKYLWYEEGADFSGPEEMRNIGQSVKRGGNDFVEIVTYNPPNDPQSWINKEVEKVKPRRYVHTSTYLDVPREWLGEEFLLLAEELKAENQEAYDHEYMGIAVGLSEAIIFGGKTETKTFEPDPSWDGPYFGADWGFSQDPSTLVKCWIEVLEPDRPIDKAKKNLYIEYAEFGKGIELDGYEEFYDVVPDVRKRKIMADCSQPATISHVASKGFTIEGAEKWPGSVEDGITVLKGFNKIFIHTRCKQMQEEARLYQYKIDRMTNEVTTDIVDKFNHGWDAVRYALAKFIKRKAKGLFDVRLAKK